MEEAPHKNVRSNSYRKGIECVKNIDVDSLKAVPPPRTMPKMGGWHMWSKRPRKKTRISYNCRYIWQRSITSAENRLDDVDVIKMVTKVP